MDPPSPSFYHLDDITAITTATLLKALPDLARLSDLVGTWLTRLAVLRQVPAFQKQLEDASVALKSAWNAIGLLSNGKPLSSGQNLQGMREQYFLGIGSTLDSKSNPQHSRTTIPESTMSPARSDLTRRGLEAIQTVLVSKVGACGRKLDRILDELEGQVDVVPGIWIEDIEQLEQGYSEWVYEAEAVVLQNELTDARKVESNNLVEAAVAAEGGSVPPAAPSLPPSRGLEVDSSADDLANQDTPTEVDPVLDASVSDNSSFPTNTQTKLVAKSQGRKQSPVPTSYAPKSSRLDQHRKRQVGGASLETHKGHDMSLNPEMATLGKLNAPGEMGIPWGNEKDRFPSTFEISHGRPIDKRPALSADGAADQALSEDSPTTKKGRTLQHGLGLASATSPYKTEVEGIGDKSGPGGQAISGTADRRDVERVETGKLSTLDVESRSSRLPPAPVAQADVCYNLTDTTDIPLLPDGGYSPPPRDDSKGDLSLCQPSILAIPEVALHTSPMPLTNGSSSTCDSPGPDRDHRFSERLLGASSDNNTAPTPGTIPKSYVGSLPLGNLAARRLSNRAISLPGDALDSDRRHSSHLSAMPPAVPAPVSVREPSKDTLKEPLSALSQLSDLSSPELRDAIAAISHRPVFVHSRPLSSSDLSGFRGNNAARRQDERAQDSSGRLQGVSDGLERRRSLSLPGRNIHRRFYESLCQSQHTLHGHGGGIDGSIAKRDLVTPLVSATSIEAVNKPAVKSIEVRPSNASLSSKSTLGQRTKTSKKQLVTPPPSKGLMGMNNEPLDNDEAIYSRRVVQGSPDLMNGPLESPSRSLIASTATSKTDGKMWRSRHRQSLGSSDATAVRFPKKNIAGSAVGKNSEFQLEDKISSILTTIPAHIRLTSAKDAKTGSNGGQKEQQQQRQPPNLSTPTRPVSAGYPQRNHSSTDLYTLAPAGVGTPGSEGRNTMDNADVKLYHLRRAGADAPIKLFVRLVGAHNNERVMVRVGGGWADLGEYLRDYAMHHSRRSNVDITGVVEVTRLPNSSTPSSVSRRGGEGSSSSDGTPSSTARHGVESGGGGTGAGTNEVSTGPTSRLGRSRPSSLTPVPSAIRRSRGQSSLSPEIVSPPLQNPTGFPPSTVNISPSASTSTSSSASTSPTLVTSSEMINQRKFRDGNPQPSTPGHPSGGIAGAGIRRSYRRNEPLSADKQAWVDDMIGKVRRGAGSADFSSSYHPSSPTSSTGIVSGSVTTNQVMIVEPSAGGGRIVSEKKDINDGNVTLHDDYERDREKLVFGDLGKVGRTSRLYRKDTS